MDEQLRPDLAQPGDWLVAAFPSGTERRGQILDISVSAGRTRFRVRWNRDHESMFYPDMRQIRILPGPQRDARPGAARTRVLS